jgi:hypothetical protein
MLVLSWASVERIVVDPDQTTSDPDVGVSRWTRIRMGLTGPEWARVAAMAAVIIGLHLVGWVDPTRKVHWLTFEPIRVAIAALPLPWAPKMIAMMNSASPPRAHATEIAK